MVVAHSKFARSLCSCRSFLSITLLAVVAEFSPITLLAVVAGFSPITLLAIMAGILSNFSSITLLAAILAIMAGILSNFSSITLLAEFSPITLLAYELQRICTEC